MEPITNSTQNLNTEIPPIRRLPPDLLTNIFLRLSFNDRRNLQKALQESRDCFAEREVLYYNLNEQPFSCFEEMTSYFELLGDKTSKIQKLNLLGFKSDKEGLKQFIDKCPNVKKISSVSHAILQLIRNNSIIENLECHFSIIPYIFPKRLIPKLTCVHLSPKDDDELKKAFDILKEALPKITKLKIHSLEVTKLPEEKNYELPILEELDFANGVSLKETGDMLKLRKIHFFNNTALEKIGSMPLLQDAYFGNCLLEQLPLSSTLQKVNFFRCAIKEIPSLLELQILYINKCGFLERIGNMPLVKSVVIDNNESLKEIGDMPMMQEGSHIVNCPKLEKMGNIPLDICFIDNCPSLKLNNQEV